MPEHFSTLFDSLLVIAGLVLVVTGLVMFIRSKTASAASSVEAFGIKLNVTHPSLILVLAGVGLMLAPRLLPDMTGQRDAKPDKAVVADLGDKPTAATPAISAPLPAPASPPTPAVQSPAPAAAMQAPAAQQPTPPKAAVPTAQPASAGKAVAGPAATPMPTASLPKPHAPKAAKPVPAVVANAPASASTHPTAEPTAAPAPPSTPTRTARPVLAYAALGLPISRAFWSGETQAGYTRRMNETLHQTGREVLRMETRGLDFNQAAFDAWWNESNAHARSRELCGSARALLTARVETPMTISSVESAYWPELRLRLYDCATQRVYRQQKTLAPNREDVWPFSVELNAEIERFARTYRADFAD